jgi:membrane protease YdiL (CAAX protease family)
VYAVYWTRSLWPAVIMHFTNNLVALIVFKTQDDPFNLADGKEFSFGPLMIVLSVALTGVLLWLLSSNKAQNPSANASV